MSSARRQVVVGAVATLALCALALAGADRPPPPGFVLLVVLIAAWAALVSLARWRSRAQRRPLQWLATAAAGTAAALALWLALWLGASPSGDVAGVAMLIGAVVAAVCGALGGTALAVASWLWVDRGPRPGTSPTSRRARRSAP